MFPTLGFPVNLTRHDDDRVVVGEVDFFSDRNKSSPPPSPHQTNITDDSAKKEIPLHVDTGLQLLTANTGSDQSTVDDGVSSDAEDKRPKATVLAQLQEDIQRINAENQKLKEVISHVSSNYTKLQVQLVALMQQQHNQCTESKEHEVIIQRKAGEEKRHGVPRQFLDLGSSGAAQVDGQASDSFSDERTRSSTPQNNKNIQVGARDYVRNNNIGKNESNSETESQGWDPNKLQKLNPSSNAVAMDQSTTEATMRKPRVSVRALSEAPMISDGCQWRKYGQKMAKGNPCPRAYYRCTMAIGCPVRKQVQRFAEDTRVLITTYEGTHNHPLPPAAMAMASTTAAAASMLVSGSMSSGDNGIMNPNNLLARAILPNCSSSMATLSASAPFPTVTLDLTVTHNPNSLQFQRPAAQLLYNYNQSKFSGLHLSSQELGTSQMPPPTPPLADTLTADPNFTALLAAAISSIICGPQPNNSTSANPNIINSTTISSFSGN